MEKKDIDWGNLGFGYIATDKRYVSNYKDGAWDEGVLTDDANVVINECAGVLQYAQTVFEGLKAYTTEDGRIVTFRPDLNAERLEQSAMRLEMPAFPKERFVEAVIQTVKANAAYVPPYGTGATLYIRPYMFGTNPVIGVKPADEYQFRVFCTPVGPYFKGGVKPLTICVSDFDRAAPHGTGHIKAGLNYAMSMHAIMEAHRNGFDENMYLDAATRTKVEETGGANFLFVTKDGKVVTPKSGSILPSITRRSLIYVAKEYLGLEVEEREVFFDEVKEHSLASLPYYIGVYLERIYDLLQEQIYHSLGFEAAEGEGASRGRASDLTVAFIDRIPHIKYLLSTDVKAILDGDPAAKSVSEIIFCYPAISALLHQRVAHELFRLGIPVLPRMMTEMAHSLTGIDIHPGAEIGAYFSIDHGTGVVVGQTAVIGNHVRLYQGVTLGAKSFTLDEEGLPMDVPRHPIIEDDVTIYSNASVLGRITIGRGSVIGGNIWLTHSVPPGSKIVQSRAVHE